MKKRKCLYAIIVPALVLSTLSPLTSYGQETVFNGLKSNQKRADRFYTNQNYPEALGLYLEVVKNGKGNEDLFLKIARTYHQVNKPNQAVEWFEKYLETNHQLSADDAYLFAESLSAQKRYTQAIEWYKKYQKETNNQEVIAKIWRIQNINYLYADSAYFEISLLPLNTDFSENSPALIDSTLIFVSNRKVKGGISIIDPVTGQSLQSLYQADLSFDSANSKYSIGRPKIFLREFGKKLHTGSATGGGNMIAFTKNSFIANTGESLFQLYFLEKMSDQWVHETPFQYNEQGYSINHPCLSTDGQTLYFVSDMPGGMGGDDIYRCHRTPTGWTKPENLSQINTMEHETTPFIFENELYFASNGHGGFGGLDVFRINLGGVGKTVENLGYPINTQLDDYGLILNPNGTHGFFTSNRRNGGFDYDIYQVVIDLQAYPLQISGVLRFNDPDWSDQHRLELLAGAKLLLVDHVRNQPVFKTITDKQGRFELEIPYSSRYKLQVRHEKVGEPTVSLEISKNRKLHKDHEIVVFSEKFANQELDEARVHDQNETQKNSRTK